MTTASLAQMKLQIHQLLLRILDLQYAKGPSSAGAQELGDKDLYSHLRNRFTRAYSPNGQGTYSLNQGTDTPLLTVHGGYRVMILYTITNQRGDITCQINL